MDLIAIFGAVVFFVGVLASIALHEVGHMVPAKLFDVRVTQYMVGFGPTLWSRRRGETEYGVKAIPLGGYVRMIGMFPPAKDGRLRRSSTGPFQTLIEEARAVAAEEVRPGEEHRLFYRKKWWQKLIIMVGGPLMNVLLAVILFSIVFMGFGVNEPKPIVAQVPDCVIPATEQRTCRPDDPVAPAKQAGIRPGDTIVTFNGSPVTSWEQLSELIRQAGAGPATVVVERDGRRLTLRPTLIAAERPKPTNMSKTETVGFLGISPRIVHERKDLPAVVGEMGRLTAATAHALVHVPERMVGVVEAAFGGERAQDSPMSIIGASRVAGQIATLEAPVSSRVASFVQWLAALNLFVALFNFIPLLPLDGGHIAGALWEALRRWIARLLRRPDPGYVDVARALPLAYAVASVIVVMGVLLIFADIVNPVRL